MKRRDPLVFEGYCQCHERRMERFELSPSPGCVVLDPRSDGATNPIFTDHKTSGEVGPATFPKGTCLFCFRVAKTFIMKSSEVYELCESHSLSFVQLNAPS